MGFRHLEPVRVATGQQQVVPVLDVVIPVYNEQDDLDRCVRRLHRFLTETMHFAFCITIVDNASTDTTLALAKHLSHVLPEVRVIHLDRKGKGLAVKTGWSASQSPVLAYMDLDLSTDLAAVYPLVAPLLSGHSDLAIGSRLHRGARVVRGAKREFISRGYNGMLRTTMSARFSDATCGFKAIRAEVAAALLPHVKDETWFFDTELLVLAERSGLRIHEVPVDWVDDPDSSVPIATAVKEDLRGILRLTRSIARGQVPLQDFAAALGRDRPEPGAPGVPPGMTAQLIRFCAVGVVSTVLYLLTFLGARDSAGAQTANAVALLLATVANTAMNRRFTFGVVGRAGAGRHQLRGMLVFALMLSGTSAALRTAHLAGSSRVVELALLVGVNLTATLLRFVLLRRWVFRKA
jgi:putative flippase GtrA